MKRTRRTSAPQFDRVRFFASVLLFVLAFVPLVLGQEGEATTDVETPSPSSDEGVEEEAENDAPERPAGAVRWVTIDSIIHPVAAEHLLESLEEADAARAEALVIELNTPGGLLTSTRDIFKAMISARTPVVVWVGPGGAQAASAGFFLLMASDVAAMAPGTNTGAAHPVGGQGKDIEGHMGQKVEEDAAATIRSLARQHGRDVELAEAAVVESRSFTADEALEAGLVEILAPDRASLLQQLDGRTIEKGGEEPVTLRTADAEIVDVEMPAFQKFRSIIAHPEIAYILMSLGFLGLYTELSNPGAILPGVAGAICLILAFYALSVLPTNYAGVALVVLALVFFVAETQVASFGLLTLGGLIALVLGSVMLFETADPAVRVGTELIVGSVVLLGGTAGLLSMQALRVRRSRVTTGSEGLVGERGVARTDLDPVGKVFVHGELWSATSTAGPIASGSAIEVASVEGLSLSVVPVAAPVVPHLTEETVP